MCKLYWRYNELLSLGSNNQTAEQSLLNTKIRHPLCKFSKILIFPIHSIYIYIVFNITFIVYTFCLFCYNICSDFASISSELNWSIKLRRADLTIGI